MTRWTVEDIVLSHLGLPEETNGIGVAFVSCEMAYPFMNGLVDEIPKGYSLIKRSHRYVKVVVAIGILCQ